MSFIMASCSEMDHRQGNLARLQVELTHEQMVSRNGEVFSSQVDAGNSRLGKLLTSLLPAVGGTGCQDSPVWAHQGHALSAEMSK